MPSDRFHLYADADARVVAIEDTPDAIDAAAAFDLVRRLVKTTVGWDQAQTVIRSSGGQVVYGKKAA